MPVPATLVQRNLRLDADLDRALQELARLASLSLNTTVQGLVALALETCTTEEGLAQFYAAVGPYTTRVYTKHTSRRQPRTG